MISSLREDTGAIMEICGQEGELFLNPPSTPNNNTINQTASQPYTHATMLTFLTICLLCLPFSDFVEHIHNGAWRFLERRRIREIRLGDISRISGQNRYRRHHIAHVIKVPTKHTADSGGDEIKKNRWCSFNWNCTERNSDFKRAAQIREHRFHLYYS